MTYAPILLFTYSRADHAKSAVESLLCNIEAKDTDIYIFSDGPKTEEKRIAVNENRKYIHSITGFKSIHVIERENNWGLSKSLITGITEIIEQYGKVIVVEDDLVLSPFFLKYMNEALNKYENDERVSSISAFLNPVTNIDVPDTFFLRYFACWGWATWKRAWKLLNPNSKDLLRKIRWKVNEFNIGGNGPFYGILYCDKVGLNDSWAVRFYASCFLENKLNLFPGKTMAIQSGMDGTGTHCGIGKTPYDNMQLSLSPILLADIPVVENKEMYKVFSSFYKRTNTPTITHIYHKLKFYIRILLGIDYR